MKAFIQCLQDGTPMDYDVYNACCGFREMGWEIVFVRSYQELAQMHEKQDVIVGGIGMVRRRLKDFGIAITDTDYPPTLRQYFGRKIWLSTINRVNSEPEMYPVFIKPVENKRFIGRVVHSPKDLIGCGNEFDNAEIYCSEVVQFLAEYRAFIRYGQVLDVRRYKGDWRTVPDPEVIGRCVADYADAPKGFAMDFGVTDSGQTLLIEVNNTTSLGSYGLMYIDYAKLLSARWAELTGTEDECAFDIR
ncbi:MAG: ATP-grasp domain-containing protein [Oscillospiraceae bacterium]|nr:ATP-grasp domain-containing protein [Oscillospiraceae bacterium]